VSENELDESRTPETSAADSSAVMESVEPHGDEPASHVSPGDHGGAEGLDTDVPDESDGTDETDVLDDGLGAPTLAAALEALLIVTEQPMQAAELAALVRCPEAEVCDVLEQLSADYAEAGRGFDLRQVAGGWRFYTRADSA
jgi:segregation and condensation protein B